MTCTSVIGGREEVKVQDLDSRFSYIKTTYENSSNKIDKLISLNDSFKNSGVFLAINGSLARRELVNGSDFDAFIVKNRDVDPNLPQKLWDGAQDILQLRQPGSAGVFGKESVVNALDVVQHIGGNNDNNLKITQRMLLILESISAGDTSGYDKLCEEVIGRYISEKITDHQLGLFLLNDIIRYYRTICVDFEYKTEEEGKPWGIRNIKLIFSRKLIYFSGIIICAELGQRTFKQKREICLKLIRMTPVERLLHILREEAFESLLFYERFLEKMADDRIRKSLESIDSILKGRDNETFREMKNDGHHFTWALRSAFMRHYDGTHPIHKAIMF